MAKLGCEELDPNNIDFKNPKSALKGLLNLFRVPRSLPQRLPKELLLGAINNPGLSPSLTAAKIIQRQTEAGIPVGPLPSGKISPDEIMWTIAVDEIYKSIRNDMRIDVVIPPGGQSVINGFAGGVPIVGTSTRLSSDGGVGSAF